MNKSKHNATIAVYFDDLVEWFAKDELGFFAAAAEQKGSTDIREAIKDIREHGVQVIVVYIRERNGSESVVRQRLQQLRIEVDAVVAQDDLLSSIWSVNIPTNTETPELVQQLLMSSLSKHPDKLELAASKISANTKPIDVKAIRELKEAALDIRDRLDDLIDILDGQIYNTLG